MLTLHAHSENEPWLTMTARKHSACAECYMEIRPGIKFCWNKVAKVSMHPLCHEAYVERGKQWNI